MNKLWAAMIVPVVGFFGAMASVYADSTLVTVNISNTSLELDVPASPTILTLNPTASGANFGYVDLTATVGTNNPTGYQLSVTFSDTSLSRTVAVDGTTPTISTLDTLAGGYPEADFTVNRWGHKITGDNYFPVPSSTLSPESWSSDEPVNNAPNVITLAAKADGTIPSGIYETTLTYTLVANIVDPDPDTTTIDEAFAAATKTKDPTSDKYKMQDMNSSICNAVTTGQTGELVDVRDGTVYRVGKLADDKCWLLDNLALDLLDEDASTNITAANTNADTTSLNALFGTATRDASTDPDGNYATAGVANWTSSYSFSAPLMNISNKDVVSSDALDTAGGWKVGGYYNYCAASAGSYCYGDGTSEGSPSGNAAADICPSGWRMPTGGASGEYQLLTNAITGGDSDWIDTEPEVSNIRMALSLPLSGYFYNGSADGQGSYGFFWSSTYYSSLSMYYLLVYTSGVSPQDGDDRRDGDSVRCIAKTSTETVPSGN